MALKSVIAAAAILAVTAYSASASVVETVNMTFLTGATFSGSMTFADNFSSILGVNGVLTGYQVADPNYSPLFSDTISTVNSNTTFPDLTAPGALGTYLFDGPESNFSHLIVFAYDYSGAPTLAFTSVFDSSGLANSVDFVDFLDPLVSGSISPVAATPLPSTWTMLLLGLAGLGWMLGRPVRRAAVARQFSL
jgi:hypothetical protein